MTPEVQARKNATDQWAEEFAAHTRDTPLKAKKDKALAVIALDPSIRHYLAEHDPMALKQVQEALNGLSYCDYLRK
jgi:hypothetical protein